MATGETNFTSSGRKTWKKDLTPPARGEQVLILRTDGDKTQVMTSDKILAGVNSLAQVKGSGIDGAPDKWVKLTFWLDTDGDRAGVDSASGILRCASALGEAGIPVKVMTSTHPTRREPAKHLDAKEVAEWLRTKNKREMKAILEHRKRYDVKVPKELKDYEAYVDEFIVDTAFNPSSPDDVAPPEEPTHEQEVGEDAMEADPEQIDEGPPIKKPPTKNGKKR